MSCLANNSYLCFKLFTDEADCSRADDNRLQIKHVIFNWHIYTGKTRTPILADDRQRPLTSNFQAVDRFH